MTLRPLTQYLIIASAETCAKCEYKKCLTSADTYCEKLQKVFMDAFREEKK